MRITDRLRRRAPLRARCARAQAGIGVVEVLVAALVLVVGMTATFLLIAGAASSTGLARQRDAGVNLARAAVENARSVPFSQLLPGTVEASLQATPGLADDDPETDGWQIERRNTVYQLTAEVCDLDDPNDGLGAHDADFCADGPPAGTSDPEPLDLRRLTVRVEWTQGKQTHRTEEVAYIARSGQPDAPSVDSITMTSATSPVTTALASLSFAVATSRAASKVVWGVDGGTQGEANGSGTAWTFVWPITDLVDGSYVVSAQSVDGFGVPGTANGITVVLNRFAPAAPTGVVAGRNGNVVEVSWHGNPERDIVGYRVYRHPASGSPTEACPLTTELGCRDLNPPGVNGSALTYRVVAVDRDASGALREGAPSDGVNVNVTNSPPAPPSGLAATMNAAGEVTLTWTASPGDPDAGDQIAFYRVYRDGVAYEDRYDRTGLGTETTYVDGQTGGVSHSYAITAVDTHLAESTMVGPVTP